MNNRSINSQFLIGENFRYILFETSIHYAKEGFQVWYISNIPFDEVPEKIHAPEKDVLKLITFIYMKDFKSLIAHLNGVHLWRTQPRIVLIEGFEEYSGICVENYRAVCGALVSTAILDACSVVSKTIKKVVHLVITCKLNEIYVDRLKVLRDLYFLNILKHLNDDETLLILRGFQMD